MSEFKASFLNELAKKAALNRKRIVLPESDDERILKAAADILQKGIANLVLLGDQDTVQARASALNLDLSAAEIVPLNDADKLARYTAKLVAVSYTHLTLPTNREV